MAVTTAGFLRKCCPSDVFGAIRLAEAADDADCPLLLAEDDVEALRDAREYGADAADDDDAPDGRARLPMFFGMLYRRSKPSRAWWCTFSGGRSSRQSQSNTHPPIPAMASASERRAQRELAEARQSGNAPPEIDVKSGAMINPHNPEFITKKPWYLAEGTGGDGGPTLDHQADQQDRRTISLAEADALVREERERIKEKLRKQRTKLKKSGRIGGDDDDDDDDDLFEVGMWIEALKKNKRPYLIAQIIKAASDKKGRFYDLQYEDGYIERSVRPLFGNSGGRDNVAQRMRVTKSGSRATTTTTTTAGKESYDSKRDAYHGVEIDNHTKKMEERYREREALRKEQRQKEREREKAEKEQRRNEMEDAKARGDIEGEALLLADGGGGNASANDAAENNSADSDSDSDSDAGNASDNDDGFSSDDEIVDKDGKLFESRLARQGGVGGAQMKVTARNLRIREDTAKYLRNLDPNSAYYDPKSRSMRDNPYASTDAAGDTDDAAVARQAEMRGFAGDNYARISGDAVGLAETRGEEVRRGRC